MYAPDGVVSMQIRCQGKKEPSLVNVRQSFPAPRKRQFPTVLPEVFSQSRGTEAEYRAAVISLFTTCYRDRAQLVVIDVGLVNLEIV